MFKRDFVSLQIGELTRLLGCQCTPCVFRDQTTTACPGGINFAGLFGEKSVLMLTCIENACRVRLDSIVQLDSGHIGFAIPLESDDFLPWFGIGTLRTSCPISAEKLIAAAGQSVRMRMELLTQQDAMETASRHMSQVMREQAWLRDLANHTRLEQSRLGIENIGRTIFEPLRNVIHAESVGLLVEAPDSNDVRQLRSQCYGSGNWDSDDMRSLLAQLEKPEPRSVNSYAKLDIVLKNGRVRSAIVASLDGSEESKYLIAINHLENGCPNTKPSFGTHHVGLMQEASLYLASHTINLRTLLESEELVVGTLQAMSQAIEARDPYTRGHSDRVAKMAFEIARRMGLPNNECQEILLSGVLHDIGKIGVPDAILQKPGKLTEEERAAIEKHPEIGHGILEKLSKLHFALPGVLYHHERWDGQGYPHKLRGTEIPLMARILAVADAFDAMTSSRPYRVGMRLEKTRGIMQGGAGVQWDADIVKLFWEWLDSQQQPSNGESVIPLAMMEETPTNVLEAITCLQLAF